MRQSSGSSGGFKLSTLLTSNLATTALTILFTWLFFVRAQPIILTYGITTVSIGKDEAVASLIPELKILVGNAEIPAVHIHSIEFTVQSGRDLDSGVVAIQFNSPPTYYSKTKIETPSDIHRLTCVPVDNGFECTFAPLSTAAPGKYKISLASNHAGPPRLISASNKVQLADVDQFVRDQRFRQEFTVMISVLVLMVPLTIYLLLRIRQLGRETKERWRDAEDKLERAQAARRQLEAALQSRRSK